MGSLRIRVTRDSVCAGDDVHAPHLRVLEAGNDCTAEEIVRVALTPPGFLDRLLRRTALPRIEGGKATWCVHSRVPLAVIAQQWSEPRMLQNPSPKLEELAVSGGAIQVHIEYLGQMDPAVAVGYVGRASMPSSALPSEGDR